MSQPTTADGWREALRTVTDLRDEAKANLVDAERAVTAAFDAFVAWRESPAELINAWEPICARMSHELGTDFVVQHNGGGTYVISGCYGPVRVTISDWLDSDLSHPDTGCGWWVGFTLPDSPWLGITESICGDPDARGADGLIRLVAHAVSQFVRGERYRLVAPSEASQAVIDYARSGLGE